MEKKGGGEKFLPSTLVNSPHGAVIMSYHSIGEKREKKREKKWDTSMAHVLHGKAHSYKPAQK